MKTHAKPLPAKSQRAYILFFKDIRDAVLGGGAVFSVYDPQGRKMGPYSTNASGEIKLPVTLAGHYTVTEEMPPKYHLLPDVRTQHAEVEYAKTSTVTFWDVPYENLRVHKVSDTGDNLDAVTIQIKNTVSYSGSLEYLTQTSGGTAYTVRYAKHKGLAVFNLTQIVRRTGTFADP